jgi:hypothetical protein
LRLNEQKEKHEAERNAEAELCRECPCIEAEPEVQNRQRNDQVAPVRRTPVQSRCTDQRQCSCSGHGGIEQKQDSEIEPAQLQQTVLNELDDGDAVIDVLCNNPLEKFFPIGSVNSGISPIIRPRMRTRNRIYAKSKNNEYADGGDFYNLWRKPGIHRIVRCFNAIPARGRRMALRYT